MNKQQAAKLVLDTAKATGIKIPDPESQLSPQEGRAIDAALKELFPAVLRLEQASSAIDNPELRRYAETLANDILKACNRYRNNMF